MHKFTGIAGPNDFHIDAAGILQPGLNETQHRILPTSEQLSEEAAKLDQKAQAIADAEKEIDARVQAAKDSLVAEQQKLREERELFDKQRADFAREQKRAGK